MAPVQDELSNGDGSRNHSHPQLRIAIIGAGSRGDAYARATIKSELGIVTTVVEPVKYKRDRFGSKYIWSKYQSSPDQAFEHWKDFVTYEWARQQKEAVGNSNDSWSRWCLCLCSR